MDNAGFSGQALDWEDVRRRSQQRGHGSIAVVGDAARGLGMTPFSGKYWCANTSRRMSIGSPRWRGMQLGIA